MPPSKDRLKEMLLNYKYVFAWTYEDLKDFKGEKFKHHILFKPDVVSFKKKLHNYNPKVSKAVQREVDKMLKA